MMTLIYSVLDLVIKIVTPFSVEIESSSAPFCRVLQKDDDSTNESYKIDLTVLYNSVKRIPTIFDGIGHSESGRIYIESEKEWQVFFQTNKTETPYAKLTWNQAHSELISYEYLETRLYRLKSTLSICNMLCLERIFLDYRGLILHSSLIFWRNQGILFTAPSGTGKSTQAGLWEKYEGAEIINGDRAGLRKKENSWMAYGLPYAGSSNIFKNKRAPVSIIFVLRQGEENRVRRLSTAEAISYLWPELLIHRWDEKFSNRALDLALDLVKKTPIYLLECRPDLKAVEVAKKVVLKEMDLK